MHQVPISETLIKLSIITSLLVKEDNFEGAVSDVDLNILQRKRCSEMK